VVSINHSACLVQIAKKSVKSIKAKVPSFVEVMDCAILESLGEDTKTSQKVEYHSTNIIPIPHILTKTYLSLTDFTPASVAKAFYETMFEHDWKMQNSSDTSNSKPTATP
jgi:hypothetical protein